MPHAFGIAHDDDAVCDGLFNTEGGPVSVFGGRCDFGDEDGGAAECCQFLAQGEKEIPYQLLGFDFVTQGGDRIDHQTGDPDGVHNINNGFDEGVHVIQIKRRLLQPEP